MRRYAVRPGERASGGAGIEALEQAGTGQRCPVLRIEQGGGRVRHLKMSDIDARPLVLSETISVWNVVCRGECRHQSDVECAVSTHMVFPYRGMYLHHIGRAETVAEANQVVFINEDEPYRVSHPIEGGDATVSIGLSAPTLLELMPAEYRDPKGRAAFNRTRLRIDSQAQAGAAKLRHRLHRGKIEKLEAE